MSKSARSADAARGDRGDQADIQAVSRVSQILSLFDPATPEVTPAEVAERLGLNRTTAYRYCTSLVAAGLLERKAEGGYVPGGLLLQLGAFAIGHRRVINLAPRHMRALSRATQTSVVLSLWGLTGPVVSRVEENASTIVVVSVRVGSHLPLDTAQSKVFLAYHADQLTMERLMANLPGPARDELRAEVERVRAVGHCSAMSTPGVVAVAAPVFDEYGICATIAIVGTDNTLSMSDDTPELRVVVDTARELTQELGGHYRPDDSGPQAR
ncbi:helix-turn-helix domain-containing protein [Amycolatopsis acidiphila]|uniref:Helix-turn-helix domain-containing protein n=1 Tax=Amycolatopsis acidiphila TaxID=715473 RepID=A0A558ACH2_9PSEU|nr:helix-turn-helix domain-containing protein [Amycolatopsis acidiphila]TVT21935.1 helix-turn-helix domain-containing protein [Amycolatopsis acidiphila]UIJ57359.1 helix-turn-helix domain-containing protein [Amycolatopsis acidiphila]GHG84618.1 IclR family transcriptional regulator [Amycolatopsis acidiphila]